MIVARDFNAYVLEWGAAKSDSRGRIVPDIVFQLELMVAKYRLNVDFKEAWL